MSVLLKTWSEHAKSNQTTISHIWVICHLLPFAKEGQDKGLLHE